MAQVGQGRLVKASDIAEAATVRHASNGIPYANVGETQLVEADLDRMVQAVPAAIAHALKDRTFYFVPLALPEPSQNRSQTTGHRVAEETVISPAYNAELAEEAICHRNVALPATPEMPAHEGVFVSVRLLNDRFALCFEFFINVAHAFVDAAGVPAEFSDLAWAQALAETRGETSQDASEARTAALADKARPDEKARLEFSEAAFADALAIYQLSLAVDFDYSELREREYPLLAPAALADRLRLVARLFPPNEGYEFSIRYRRRA